MQVLYVAVLPALSYTLARSVLYHKVGSTFPVLLGMTCFTCLGNILVARAASRRFATYRHDDVRSGFSVARALSTNEVLGVSWYKVRVHLVNC